jgi:peptide deformylase
MEIIKYPDSRLFKPCKPVTVFDENLNTLLEAMWETMKRERGMGLAANQVGLESRMFTMEGPNEEKIFLVNPKILEFGKTPSPLKEGCLSAPGQMISLFRPMWVKVTFQDQTGKAHARVFSDIHSICVQHEIEHLDGKSFLQNKAIPKATRKQLAEKWGIKLK